MTTVMSCTMIDAVTYGMIPSAKIEKRDNPPPENRFSRLKIPPVRDRYWSIASASTPGDGIHDPSRYSARIIAVKRSRRRISGTRQALASQANISGG